MKGSRESMFRAKAPSSNNDINGNGNGNDTTSQGAAPQGPSPSLADLVGEARNRQQREEQRRFERQTLELYEALRRALSPQVERALRCVHGSFPGTTRPCFTFEYEGELFYLRQNQLGMLVVGLLAYADNWLQNACTIACDNDLLLYLDRTIGQVRSGE